MALYVLSDLHLEESKDAPLFDDGRQGRALAALCGRIAEEPGAELVLLGDVFDFTSMLPPPVGLGDFYEEVKLSHPVPPRRELPQLLEALAPQNPLAFRALAQVSQRVHVTIVPGNHDRHLREPGAAEALAAAGLRAELQPALLRELAGRRVVLQHGHEFDKGNRDAHGGGEVMTNALHHAVIPFLIARHRPEVRIDPGRVVSLRPEEAVVSVLQRWLDPKTFDLFFRAFLRLLARNRFLPGALAWLSALITANRVRSAVASQDRLWERTGLHGVGVLCGERPLRGPFEKAPPPDVLVLGHTHVLDWALAGEKLYVNLGTWTERAFDALSPRDQSLPVLRLDEAHGFTAALHDLETGAMLQAYGL